MKSNVESRIKNYEQDLSKFESRWHQLKPTETALESGPDAGMQAVKSIKEKKLEFDELEKIRSDLEYVGYSYLIDFRHFCCWQVNICILSELVIHSKHLTFTLV